MKDNEPNRKHVAAKLVEVARAGGVVALDCTVECSPPTLFAWPDENDFLASLDGSDRAGAVAFVDGALQGEGLVKYTFFNAARCNLCNHVVDSRTPDDESTCACGNLTVGGGIDRMERTADRATYTELSLYAWAPPAQREEFAQYAENGTTVETLQQRVLASKPPRSYTITGHDEGGAERHLVQEARMAWEAALLAREAEPGLVITKIMEK